MSRITITLMDYERRALQTLADQELRNPRDQAALIVKRELQRLGLLPIDAPAPTLSQNDAARVEGVKQNANAN